MPGPFDFFWRSLCGLHTSGVSDKLCNELIAQSGLLCYADHHDFLRRRSCEVASQRHLFSKQKTNPFCTNCCATVNSVNV